VWRELESVIAGFLRTFLPICSATLLLHGEGVEKRGVEKRGGRVVRRFPGRYLLGSGVRPTCNPNFGFNNRTCARVLSLFLMFSTLFFSKFSLSVFKTLQWVKNGWLVG